MIGRLDPSRCDVTVVGGGIAGLLAAYYLDRAGFSVTLREASDRLGGLIATVRTAHGPAEAAAHSLLATPAVRELCAELGVELVEVRPAARARFVLRGGRLRRFPLSLPEALGVLARAYFVRSTRAFPAAELTLEEWGRRFLGPSALRFLLVPFVRGIYGARPSELTVRAAFPALAVPPGHSLLSWALARWWRGLGGPRRARPRMVAPRGGMEALTAALAARLRERLGGRLVTGSPVSRLAELPAEANWVLAVPARAAGALVGGEEPELGRSLGAVPCAGLVGVTVFARREAFAGGAGPRGVGVLAAEGEPVHGLGILFNSSAFAERVTDDGLVSLTEMLGGSSRPELLDESDDRLRELVARDLEALFGVAKSGIVQCVIHRWPQAIPRYGKELEQAWEVARRGWCARPGRILFANWSGQVSLRGMIDAARSLAGGLHTSGQA